MAQPSACTITGFRSISLKLVAERCHQRRRIARRPAEFVECQRPRGAARLSSSGAMPQPSDEPARLWRRRRAAAHRPRPPAPRRARRRAPISTTGPNCSSWIMPSSISTPLAAIMGATSTRDVDPLREVAVGAATAAVVGEPRWTPLLVALVVEAALRGLQHDRIADGARGRDRSRLRFRRCVPALTGRPKSREQRQRFVLIEARGRSASRARACAPAPPAEARVRRARRARREIAIIEQVAHAAQKGRQRRPAPGIPRASPRRPAGLRPCPGGWRPETPACPKPHGRRAGSRGSRR